MDVTPLLISQAFNLRPPIERPNPTFSIVSRNQASGRGSTAVATAFGSSLRSAVLDDFMVKMFHGFPKPQNKFIRDMVYGIQATGDTIITDIARAVAPEDNHRMAVACKSGARKTVPLDLKIWSSLVEGHKGETQPSPAVRRRHDDQDVRQRLRAGRLLANVAAKPFRRRLDKRTARIQTLCLQVHLRIISNCLPAIACIIPRP